MNQVFLFLHILGAIMMGFYLLLPFLAARIGALSGQAQFGFLHVLFAANRVGQLALVIELLTGGYMVGKAHYPVAWMIAAVVLLLALGAITGVLGKNMRLALNDSSGRDIAGKLGKIRSLSNLTGVLFLLIVFIMNFPNLFA
ncbi:hypothetical protein [Paenibacillus hamazuiensis]|uniref:hypothetical protein n=1 Tax=Paenibacillus hamazuiensis TaxID=2936508 RepID=UPI00200BBE4A|nr:hypothetical protein [Paenibacillus hamazuiensis]